MKKVFTGILLSAVMLVGGSAYAEDYDLGAMELNKTYTVPLSAAFCKITGTITPDLTGEMVQVGLPDISLYSSDTYADDTELPYTWNGGYGDSQVRVYDVKANTTYYAYCSFAMGLAEGANTVKFQMADEVEISVKSLTPEEGAEVQTIKTIDIYFNVGVTYSSVKIVAGGKSVAILGARETPDIFISFNPRAALNELYANGTLNEDGGDQFSVVVEGLQTPSGVKYNGDGKLEIKYIAAGKAPQLVSSNFDNSFKMKSYYTPGDPEGILELEFDRDLQASSGATASLGMGNVEAENCYYFEELTPKIEGKKVTIDLTGKKRDLQFYQQVQGSDIIEVKVRNLIDTRGIMAEGNGGEGNDGVYVYNIHYNYIRPATMAAEFTPASGSSLQGVDQIEIWYNNYERFTFTGVKFEYVDGKATKSVVVDKDKLDITTEDNEITIRVDVPAQVKGKTNITVSLDNVESLDGNDYSKAVVAYYDQFVATLLYPIVAGEAYETTGTEDFVASVNEDVPCLRYDYYAAGEWMYGTWFQKQNNGTWKAYNGDWPIYKDSENYMVIRAFESEMMKDDELIGEVTLSFIGLTNKFTYSTVKFVSINPEPNSQIEPAEDFCFTVNFDGLVTLNPDHTGILLGMGMGLMEFEKIEGIYDPSVSEDDFANVWKLYPGQSYLANNDFIDISIQAYDTMGFLVEGNMGGNDYDYLSFSYSIKNVSAAELTLTPEPESTVSKLDKIVVACSGMAVGPNYNCYEPCEIFKDDEWDPCYTFTSDNVKVESELIGTDELGYPIYSEETWVEMIIDPEITTPGVYTMIIPMEYFVIGSQYDTMYNPDIWAIYTVSTNSISSMVVEAADRYDVYTLNGMHVLSTEKIVDLGTLGRGIYIINGKKVMVK